MKLCYVVPQGIPSCYINIFYYFIMYKLDCRAIGFDCDFTIKKSDRMIIVNNFCKHMMINHNMYYPTREILGFIEKQNPNQFKDSKFNMKSSPGDNEPLERRRWFSGRKNFP